MGQQFIRVIYAETNFNSIDNFKQHEFICGECYGRKLQFPDNTGYD